MEKLKPIEIEEQLTTWRLADLLEKVAKTIKDMPRSVIQNVEYAEAEAYDHIENTIKTVNNRLVELSKAIEESDAALDKAINDHYNNTKKKIYDLNKKLAELPKINEAMHLPYHAEEIFKIAERYSHLDDEQWKKVIELAQAFAERG